MDLKKQISQILPLTLRKHIVNWWLLFIFLISVCTITAIIVDYGFVLDDFETDIIHKIYGTTWWCFFISYNIQLLFNIRNIKRKALILTIITGVMLYLSAIPIFFSAPESPSWASHLWLILGHKLFLIATLTLQAILEISRGITTIINKNTNPAMVMTAGFAIVILLGTLLLLLPRSTHEHIRLPVVDALFISTSAVCVTGLSPVDIAQTFSIEGQIVITLLIQIGGLGLMTLTSFFALFFMGSGSFYNQITLREIIGGEAIESLLSTLLYILTFTFVIEGIGAIAIWFSIHNTLGMELKDEIFFSIFHSISAFCNAGFSTLTGNLGNDAIITGHNAFYLIISVLIVLGGIGFPLLVNLKRIISYHTNHILNRLFGLSIKQEHFVHLTNINTKIVFRTTLFLILSGTIAIALLEWNNAFAQMPTADKITHAIFNAVAPRTAGFNSIDLSHFSILTLIIYTVLMWIGGASQSTAGGIKVNTFAIAIANIIAVTRGRERVTLYNREISETSIRRAMATITGSIIIIIVFFVALVVCEPNLPIKGLLFETVSAFSTVGSSLNITPLLGIDSKIIVTLLMFIGRIGFITFVASIMHQHTTPKYRYPKDDVIIN